MRQHPGPCLKPQNEPERGLVLTLVDSDHHTQQWTFRQDGKDQTETFTFTRKK